MMVEDMKYLVIACNIMKDELLRFQTNGISFVFLEQSLHRTPQKMKPLIQEEIDKADQQEWRLHRLQLWALQQRNRRRQVEESSYCYSAGP